jgi:hypothetical protein
MYRSIDTGTWKDPWFEEQPADAKLLFLYLLTNSSTVACGAAEINVRRIAFDTSLPEGRVTELLTAWHPRVVWWSELNIVWVRNFFRRQFPNANDKQLAAGQKSLIGLPDVVRDTVCAEYPALSVGSDTPPIAYPEPTDSLSIGDSPVTVTVTVPVPGAGTEPEQQQTQASAAAAPDKPARVVLPVPKPKPKPRPRNEIWDALAAACGEPATESERSDFGKTVAELDAAGATVEDIRGFPPWWYTTHPDATLTHHCYRRHWGRYLTAPARPPQISDIKNPGVRAAIETTPEELRAALRDDLAAQNGRSFGIVGDPRRLGAGGEAPPADVLPPARRSGGR